SNRSIDAFLRDDQTGTVEIISRSTAGIIGNSASRAMAMTPDGRYVVFKSEATNLAAGDFNGKIDVFVRDRQTSTTSRIIAGGGPPGQFNLTSTTPLMVAVSSNGRYVAFDSDASDLVPGDTNGRSDVFVHDRQTSTTTRVSVGSDGSQAFGGDSTSPSLSADGRYVAFYSGASFNGGDSRPRVYVRDLQSATTTVMGFGSLPRLSADGRYFAFLTGEAHDPSDQGNGLDIYVYDRTTASYSRVT